jgi:glycosyltransferase involved in cell wall biosynthesis
MNGAISVLTTLYNHEHYIGEALRSAVTQTRPPHEIVVIDDASTDGSVERVKRLAYPQVRLIEQPRNLGGATTMAGLAACRGEYVAILNSDDAWMPEKLERQAAWLEAHPECGAVFTHVELVDEEGRAWPAGEHQLEALFRAPNRSRTQWLRHFFDHGNALCASSALVRRACFERLGPLQGCYTQLQDLEAWLRLAVAGFDLHVLEDKLTRYRVARARRNMSSTSWPVRSRELYEYPVLLRNYWKLDSATLRVVFPEVPQDDGGDRLVRFHLARGAAARGTLHHRQFAVDSLFEFARDPEAVALAGELFGFSHREYRDVVAGHPLGTAVEAAAWRRFKFFVASRLPAGWLLQLLHWRHGRPAGDAQPLVRSPDSK